MIEVFPPDTDVYIGGNIPAKVIEVCIRSGRSVQYRVVWWENRTRNDKWLDALEVMARSDEKQKIGFVKG